MAEETYGIQLSVKVGDNMMNFRGADADEFLEVLGGFIDAADDNDLAAALVGEFGLGEARPKPKRSTSRSSSRGSSSTRKSSGGSRGGGGMSDPDGDPTDKQIDFAKQLKIRGYSKMTKAELSEAIDEALAKRAEDDDDD